MKIKKILFSIIFSFSFIFMTIGYAATTENLVIQGELNTIVQDNVFIYEASISSGTGTITGYVESIMSSNINLGTSNDGKVEQSITVFNNASESYGYNAYSYTVGPNTFSNENVVLSVEWINPETNKREVMPRRTEIVSKGSLEFFVVFSYKDGKYNSTYGSNLISVIDYEFFPLSQMPENEEDSAAKDAISQFEEIINTQDTFDELLSAMEGNGSIWNGKYGNEQSYTGNVEGASDDEIEIIESLFEGSMLVNINGVETHVTTLIKRENIDGNESTGLTYVREDNWWSSTTVKGCELTIYMTANNLQTAGEYAVVYAQVFTSKDGGATWFQIGDTWEGTARVCSYSGADGTGSFNTETWKSPAQSYVNSQGQTVTGSTMATLINNWKKNNPNYAQ